MKRVLLSAVVALFGACDVTDWDVAISRYGAAVCVGSMTLDDVGSKVTGTWECEPFGGAVSGTIRADGHTLIDFETRTGAFNRMRGTAADDKIVGEIRIDHDLLPFSAVRR